MRRLAMTVAGLTMAAGTTVVAPVPAEAQVPRVRQDGLVNVNIGDVNILNNANIGIAANVVANVCGVKVGPVAVLGRAVDRSGNAVTICRAFTRPVTITQNRRARQR
jgi:hypothetical protein